MWYPHFIFIIQNDQNITRLVVYATPCSGNSYYLHSVIILHHIIVLYYLLPHMITGTLKAHMNGHIEYLISTVTSVYSVIVQPTNLPLQCFIKDVNSIPGLVELKLFIIVVVHHSKKDNNFAK